MSIELLGLLTGAFALGATPLVGGYWLFDTVRARIRNRRNQCATCAISYTEGGEQYLVQGRFVCEKCAERLKKHTLVEIVVLSGLVATLSGLGVWTAISTGLLSKGLVMGVMVAAPPLAFAAALAGSIGLMKWSNRAALRRIDGQLLQLSEETGG